MANALQLIGGSVPKGLESPMKERKVTRITDIVRKENSMTNKVQKIREEVERLKESGCASPIVICDTLLAFIDSLQEEPVDKCNGCNNVKGCLTCVDGSEWAHYEEPVSEELDIAIGEYCSNPDNFITYIDVAFAYRSEQKDDIPLIIKAIKFGANWQKNQLLKDAVDGRFSYNHNFKENEFICLEKSDTPEHYLGELVKVIIIKQEEE